jgi:hypothetical protein
MPHQNPQSMKATAQNAATDPIQPNDQARGQNRSVDPEPRSYAARDVRDSTLAPPAAGETADYMDEGDPSLGAHQGRSNSNREAHAHDPRANLQGTKTRKATKDQISRRS